MAVNFTPASSTTTTNANFKKADVYANFFIEMADGTKISFGEKGIALYADKRVDAAHIKRLQEGGAEAMESLLKNLKCSLYFANEVKPPVSSVGY